MELVNRWVDMCQTDGRTGGLDVISIKIDKNDEERSREWHWGQQVGGMFGQSMVEGDGSPRWVVITRSGAHVCEKSTYG